MGNTNSRNDEIFEKYDVYIKFMLESVRKMESDEKQIKILLKEIEKANGEELENLKEQLSLLEIDKDYQKTLLRQYEEDTKKLKPESIIGLENSVIYREYGMQLYKYLLKNAESYKEYMETKTIKDYETLLYYVTGHLKYLKEKFAFMLKTVSRESIKQDENFLKMNSRMVSILSIFNDKGSIVDSDKESVKLFNEYYHLSVLLVNEVVNMKKKH